MRSPHAYKSQNNLQIVSEERKYFIIINYKNYIEFLNGNGIHSSTTCSYLLLI